LVIGFFEIGSHKLFIQAGFELQSSWVARITGVSHWHQQLFIFLRDVFSLCWSGWSWTSGFKKSLVSASQVAGIKGLYLAILFYLFWCWRLGIEPSQGLTYLNINSATELHL
jgi:hypothetical protein